MSKEGTDLDASQSVESSVFLRKFIRLGIEGRDEQRQEQRRKQHELDNLAIEEHEKKVKAVNEKLTYEVDFN